MEVAVTFLYVMPHKLGLICEFFLKKSLSIFMCLNIQNLPKFEVLYILVNDNIAMKNDQCCK